MTQGLDTLITGGHLLTMAGAGVGFVEDGAVGIRGGKIVAVGPRAQVEAQGSAATTIALGGGAGAGLGAGGREVDGRRLWPAPAQRGPG